MAEAITVRMTTADDWPERRGLRLEMLEDTPIAFLDRLADARGFDDTVWRAQAARAASPGNCSAAAIAPDGRWVGTMSGFVSGPGTATLVTVYVSPDFRGREVGVADRLLATVEGWVRAQSGIRRLILDVHESNTAAIAFYLRHGFAATGDTKPYPLDPSTLEREFVKPLD